MVELFINFLVKVFKILNFLIYYDINKLLFFDLKLYYFNFF